MSPFQRLREACRRDPRASADAASASARWGQGPSAAADALSGRPSLLTGAAGAPRGQGSQPELNRVYLSGILADDPQRDRDRNGDPLLLLRIAFAAPDSRDTRLGVEAVLQEIEVPERVAERHRGKLGIGASIFVTGQMSGGGGVLATEVHSGPPPASVAP